MAIINFKDIYTGALERTGENPDNTTLVGFLKDWINFRYKEINSLADWPYLHDIKTIRLVEKYNDEDVDIDEGSTALTGNSTVWTKDMTLRKIKFNDYGEIYTIARVVSATSITLAEIYNGDDIDDGGHTIFMDVYPCPFTWRDIVRIRDTGIGLDLERKMLREKMEENPNPYPGTPVAYAIQPERRYTKIVVDTFNGAYTIADVSVGHWFAAGTSNSYGWVKGTGTDADSNTYLVLDILYGTLTDGETLTFYSDVGTTATAVTCAVDEASGYTEGNVGDCLTVRFDPPPYENRMYNADVILKTVDLVQDYDCPYIPEDFRDILFYFALADILDFRKNDKHTYWEQKALVRLNQMKTYYHVKVIDRPRIRPPYPRVEYS
jgi:hypothetical protein